MKDPECELEEPGTEEQKKRRHSGNLQTSEVKRHRSNQKDRE